MARPHYEAFATQRRNAVRRGIEFRFTYEDWLAWWEEELGPTWPDLRGIGRGKYCMARENDTGPYSRGNVKCLTHPDNVTDAAANDTIAFGENQGCAVLDTDAARHIFTSTHTIAELASLYDVNSQTIADIRCGRTWRRVTESLTRSVTLGRNQWNPA